MPGGQFMHHTKLFFNLSLTEHLQQQNQEMVGSNSASRSQRGHSPILFPPLSPPLSHRINVSTDSDEIPKLDPLACDINYFYDGLLEHKLLPTQGMY